MAVEDWQADEDEEAEEVDVAEEEMDAAEEGIEEEEAPEEEQVDEADPDEADGTEQAEWAEEDEVDEAAETTETSEVKKQTRQEKVIWESGDGKYVVRLRQKLDTPEDAEHFCEELSENIDAKRAAGEMLIFEDFDISQNKIPFEQFEAMFTSLSDGTVQVERFRAFGLPTLDDSAAILLANWLQCVTEENAPFELHLSDCAITATGFKAIIEALSENDTFPTTCAKFPDRGKLPLYIRFEGNYIEESAIQESVDQGAANLMTKSGKNDYSDTAKCRILVREDGSFRQREGDPPPPDEAPAPKRVNDFGKGGKDKGKGKGKDKGSKGSKGGSKGGKSSKDKGKDRQRDTSWRDSSKETGWGSSRNDASKKDSSWKDSSWKSDWKDSSSKDSSWKESSWKEKDSSWKGKDSSWKEKDSSWKDKDSSWKDKDSSWKDTSKDSSWKSSSKDSSWKEGNSSWKESNGWKDQEKSWTSSGSKAKGTDSKGKGKDSSKKPWQALPDEDSSKRWDSGKGDRDRGKGKSKGSDKGGKDQSRGTAPFSAFSSGGKSSSDAKDWEAKKRPADYKTADAPAEKRTRLAPTSRTEANASKTKGTSASGGDLPAPWEKHWSEQYQLHYYWNSSTGASSWEKPTV